MVERAAVGGDGVRDACLLVQVTCWPIFTFRAAGENAKLSMATAVPLAGVPAPLVVGAAVVVEEPPPYPPEPPPQPAASTPAATSRVSATSVRRMNTNLLGCNLNSGPPVHLRRGSWFPDPLGFHHGKVLQRQAPTTRRGPPR
jgi:hypothetical protein